VAGQELLLRLIPARLQLQFEGVAGFLGLALDEAANAKHGRAQHGRITTGTKPQALVVPTNEELMIAEDAAQIARGA